MIRFSRERIRKHATRAHVFEFLSRILFYPPSPLFPLVSLFSHPVPNWGHLADDQHINHNNGDNNNVSNNHHHHHHNSGDVAFPAFGTNEVLNGGLANGGGGGGGASGGGGNVDEAGVDVAGVDFETAPMYRVEPEVGAARKKPLETKREEEQRRSR